MNRAQGSAVVPEFAEPYVAATLAEALRIACEDVSLQGTSEASCLRVELSVSRIGAVQIIEASGPPLMLRAVGAASRLGLITAVVQLSGTAFVTKADRAIELTSGSLCILRTSRPMTMEQRGLFRMLLVTVQKDELAGRSPAWREALMVPIEAGSGIPAMFCDALISLRRWADSFGEAGTDGVSEALIDLIGAVVCCVAPNSRDCAQRARHHKERIKHFARLNLSNPSLSVDFIANAVGLSARQIHRLFADEGVSLMRWVLIQRLEKCYEQLERDGTSQGSISQVAYAWGFNDQAHFSRAFRKHFGIAPRELRRTRALDADWGQGERRLPRP